MLNSGTKRRLEDGQSMSALPGYIRHQLVLLLPEHHPLSDRAFDLGVAKQKLDSPKIAKVASARRSECVRKALGRRGAAARRAQLLDYVGTGQLVENPDRDIVYDPGRNATSLRQGASVKDFDWRWITVDARSDWYFIPLDYLP
jgi:hypothetical protein